MRSTRPSFLRRSPWLALSALLIVFFVISPRVGVAGPGKVARKGDPRRLCPRNDSRRIGGGKRLNRSIVGLGTASLSAALRKRAAGWRRISVGAYPAGRAGAWADAVSARYKKGVHELTVSVTDMVRLCTCVRGMGAVLTRSRYGVTKGVSARVIKLAGQTAQFSTIARARTLGLWLGDRCLLAVNNNSALTRAQLEAAIAVVNLAALRKVCKQRQRGVF